MEKPYRCSFSSFYFIRPPVMFFSFVPNSAPERRILLGRDDLEALHYSTVTDTGRLPPRHISSAFDQLLPKDLGWWRSVARHQADPGVGPLELVKLPCANLPGGRPGHGTVLKRLIFVPRPPRPGQFQCRNHAHSITLLLTL
jgi:hypothetical protein